MYVEYHLALRVMDLWNVKRYENIFVKIVIFGLFNNISDFFHYWKNIGFFYIAIKLYIFCTAFYVMSHVSTPYKSTEVLLNKFPSV